MWLLIFIKNPELALVLLLEYIYTVYNKTLENVVDLLTLMIKGRYFKNKHIVSFASVDDRVLILKSFTDYR